MSNSVSFSWRVSPKVIHKGAIDYADRVQRAVEEVAGFIAVKIQSGARINARWTDRTGFARAGLVAFTRRESKRLVVVYLTTQAPYGVWLELRHGGQYAIVWKTIVENLPEIKKMLDAIFSK